MTDQACPGCRATKYTNPLMKLLVNVCGHSLCENCVEVMFVRGSGACPQCGAPLRRVNFRLQMFEDSSVEKEMRIRKKILKDFNRQESDFDTLDEYNDYLEMVERIIFDLVNNENVEETNKLIEAYKKDNNEEIKRNRIKKTQEMEYLEALIREEKSLHARVKKEEDEEKEMLRSQKKDKERLIDELTSSEGGASAIVQQHMANTVTSLQARELGDGMQTSLPSAMDHSSFSSFTAPAEEQFHYTPFSLPLLGPAIDEAEVLETVVTRREAQLGPEGMKNFHADWNPRAEALRMVQLGRSGLFFGIPCGEG